MNKILIFLLISSLFANLSASSGNEFVVNRNRNVNAKQFVVYDAMNYEGKPENLSADGLESVMMLYQSFLSGKDKNSPTKFTIDSVKVNTWIDKAIQIDQKMICTDIEAWYAEKGVDSLELNKRFRQLFTLFRDKIEGLEISNYGLPISALCVFRATADGKYDEDMLMKRWLNFNSRRMGCADLVDYFAPPLYIVNPNINSWVKDLEITVTEIKKIDSDKKIIPFIWPAYYDLAGSPYYREMIEPEVWIKMLKAIYENCDGVIIWSSKKDKDGNIITWDNPQVQELYQITLSFIKERE